MKNSDLTIKIRKRVTEMLNKHKGEDLAQLLNLIKEEVERMTLKYNKDNEER